MGTYTWPKDVQEDYGNLHMTKNVQNYGNLYMTKGCVRGLWEQNLNEDVHEVYRNLHMTEDEHEGDEDLEEGVEQPTVNQASPGYLTHFPE